MTAALRAIVDRWLRRCFSLAAIMVMVACLCLAKIVTLATALSDRAEGPSAEPAASAIASAPIDLATLDNQDFVPWSALFPEPAAGPEDGEDMAVSDADANEPAFNPGTLTEGEITALQRLSARRMELDERERLLDMRAELNRRTEVRLDEQIRELTGLKASIEALVTGLDEAEESKLARLVKIYETMKPKAAAEIFNRLELPVLLHVVERMKETKSAEVLGKMDPAVAERVTSELARKRNRPTLESVRRDGEV